MTALLNTLRHWFAHPQALWLLALVPLLGLLVGLARNRRRKALVRWGYGPGLGVLTSSGGPWRWLRGTARALGLTFLIVAIAGPRWGRVENPATVSGRDVVIVLDLSRSMLAQDVLGQSSPNRLGRARDGLFDLVDMVQRRGGHRLALVVFAARSQVVCPLTNDYDHFRETLRTLDPDDPLLDIGPDPETGEGKPVSGTRIGRGLQEAVRAQDARFPGHQDIILVSDGDDPARDGEWRAGITAARAQGIPVHTVGVGDPDRDSPVPGADGPLRFHGKPVTTRLREPVLEEIARQTGGTYTPARTRALPLGDIFHQRIEPRAGREVEDDLLPVYQQRSAWFFGLGLFWLTAEMALGDFSRKRRSRWSVSPSAWALGLALLALGFLGAGPVEDAERLVRQGNAAYAQRDYQAAVDLFTQAEEYTTDPGLVAFNKAAALYRLGRYAEAEAHYLRSREDARGERLARVLFDLGNSVLQVARDQNIKGIQRAIGYYEACLRQEAAGPELIEDTKFNLQLAKELLAQARAAKGSREPDESQDGSDRARDEQANQGMNGMDLQPGVPDRRGQARAVNRRPGDTQRLPGSSSQEPPPGQGDLPPIQDQDELVKMSPEETARYLEQVAARVLRERREHRRQSRTPSSWNVMDW